MPRAVISIILLQSFCVQSLLITARWFVFARVQTFFTALNSNVCCSFLSLFSEFSHSRSSGTPSGNPQHNRVKLTAFIYRSNFIFINGWRESWRERLGGNRPRVGGKGALVVDRAGAGTWAWVGTLRLEPTKCSARESTRVHRGHLEWLDITRVILALAHWGILGWYWVAGDSTVMSHRWAHCRITRYQATLFFLSYIFFSTLFCWLSMNVRFYKYLTNFLLLIAEKKLENSGVYFWVVLLKLLDKAVHGKPTWWVCTVNLLNNFLNFELYPQKCHLNQNQWSMHYYFFPPNVYCCYYFLWNWYFFIILMYFLLTHTRW